MIQEKNGMRPRRFPLLGRLPLAPLLTLLTASLAGTAVPPLSAQEREIEFNREVRPILSDRCYTCHGPDPGQRDSELRLDLEESAKGEHGGVRAIVPGDPAASELVARITERDPALRMPPPEMGKPLSDAQIETLRRWIAQGARWQEHWSLHPPRRPSAPPGPAAIDHFIERRLKRENVAALGEAEPRVLLRRLAFDLTGLPPTAAQVEAFAANPSPENYARFVEEFLASPRHAERMTQFWLDQVRYADTNGIHGDNHREHAPYRDYVLRAFARNLPFHQFTREQLAGDLLENRTPEQLVASGYNRLNLTTREGGAQAKEYLAKYSADRVRNASTVWLGATLGCSECHDHKFDPYPQRDFYRFAAFFADLQETAVGEQKASRVPTPEQQERLAAIERELNGARGRLNVPEEQLAEGLEAWARKLVEGPAGWQILRPSKLAAQGGTELTADAEGVVTAAGPNPEKELYTLTFQADLRRASALRLEVLPSDALPAQGPGRAGNGNFVLSEWTAEVDGRPLPLTGLTATHSQNGWPVAAAADGKPETGWAILPRVGAPQEAVARLGGEIGGAGESTLVFKLSFQYGGSHAIGRFRFSMTEAAGEVVAGRNPGREEELLAAAALPRGERSAAQREKLLAAYRETAPELAPVRAELAKLEAERKQIEERAPLVLVSIAGSPRTIRVLPRGNWLDDSGEEVLPGVPECLPQLELGDRRATRLDLANWLTAPENPLTARVFVNRLWKLLHGRGLVHTLDDFGSQGAWPTHPELLDWLAVEFVESGWDVRHMLRLMVMSDTYRRSSHAPAELLRRDPANELLARQGRYRLEAEMVRDNALLVSGLLVERLGGPSVKPYQPAGYWSHLNFPKREWQADSGENLYRRGLYTYWCRTFLHPSLLAMDAPPREEACVERTRSNTPLAALALLNDPTYVEAARALAERVILDGGEEPAPRLELAFARVLQRKPSERESHRLLELIGAELARYRAAPGEAEKLLGVGARPRPAGIDAAELAAYTSACRVLLNLHETVTRN